MSTLEFPTGSGPFGRRVRDRMLALQDEICRELTKLTGDSFREDSWAYDRGHGGGRARVVEGGKIFEKGGVNFSALQGATLPAPALEQLDLPAESGFFATGVSIVLHPENPHIPTMHMNVRYFEAGAKGNVWWFGGGIDMTPYYPNPDQVVAFHRLLKTTCDGDDPNLYPEFKAYCDRYFSLPHRNEMRGVGGIFFDRLQRDRDRDLDLITAVARTFVPAYTPLIQENRHRTWNGRQRRFQALRRGRYVEFNLLWDRGTKFGIESGGRTESILVSMPPTAAWSYDWQPEDGTREAEITRTYYQPQPWVDDPEIG